jgi:hypothetical protein
VKNILFLIGNGFDINLGLETKFSDVKKEYLEHDSNDPIINEFKEVLINDYENWSDFESAMGIYTKMFDLSNKDKYVDQIKSFCKILIEKFEKEEACIDYNTNSKQIYDVFVDSLINFDKNFSEKSKKALSSILSASSSNYDFRYTFVTFNYTNVLDRCIEIVQERHVGHPFRQFEDQSRIKHNVLDIIGEVLHIHGTLRENLILGVDNPSQIINEELSKDEDFQLEIVKTKINEELEEYYDINAKEMIDASSIICIFGLSIGKTDVTWWKYIFDWLISNETRHLLIFFYNENDDRTATPKIHHKNKIKDLFFGIIGNLSEQEKRVIGDRIHIAKNNGKMFRMDILFSNGEL